VRFSIICRSLSLAVLVFLVVAPSRVEAKKSSATDSVVELTTSLGAIRIELYPKKAPATVENFLRYVKDKAYDGTIFHRVIKNFMVQGGGFDLAYRQRETRAPIKNEATNGLANVRGTVAMARTGDPHSATQQFFVNVVDNDFLNHTEPAGGGWGYCVFGRVIKGMEVVDQIRAVRTGSGGQFEKDVPQQAVVINRAKVVR
jgi:cyclophilin family peptidyl-prolyl cis-trans isomerase